MKTKLLITLLLTIIFSNISEAQYYQQSSNDNNRTLYQNKVVKYKKMETIGKTMAISGTVATVLGIVLINNTEWIETTDYYGNTQYTADSNNAAIGVLSILVGIPLGIAGSVIGIIGHNKKKQYLSKLSNFAFDIITTPKQNSIKLTYNF